MASHSGGSGRKSMRLLAGLLGAAALCALCGTLGYFFLPIDFSELTNRGAQVAQRFGLVEPSSTPTPTLPPATATPVQATATPAPTSTATFLIGSPTIPPTDTPKPRPTAIPTNTPTNTPIPVPATPASVQVTVSISDLAATQTAEALSDVLTDTQAIRGAISLVAIDHNFVFPPAPGEVEFSWTWSGAAGCQPLPDGYGFEVRIWPNRPDFIPLGVEDATKAQERIFCDPQTGRRSFKLGFLPGTPAVQLQGAGSFAWDVAFIKLSPHTPLYASPPRLFEISLVYPRPGRLDPEGETGKVKCSSFVSWAEAQAFFLAAAPGDPHRLDTDRNGIACDAIAPCLLTKPVEVCRNLFKK